VYGSMIIVLTCSFEECAFNMSLRVDIVRLEDREIAQLDRSDVTTSSRLRCGHEIREQFSEKRRVQFALVRILAVDRIVVAYDSIAFIGGKAYRIERTSNFGAYSFIVKNGISNRSQSDSNVFVPLFRLRGPS
jgi:hypothetical protein